MSRRDSKAPELDQAHAVEPSPARETLKHSLDANGDLRLSKKKSWFGSLRDAVQKGALHAKAAVDSIREDQSKSEQVSSTDGDAQTNLQPRRSVESTASTAATMKSEDEISNNHTTKNAIASLRNHLPHHSSKQRHKQSSVCSASARPRSEMSEIHWPEHFASSDSVTASHKRHSSVANSLVGSIRGLGRKKGKPPELPAQKAVSPGKPPENVPLPSSPINIPVAAPALKLDLGPAAFMSSTFASPVENGRNQVDLKLSDPANIASARPESLYCHIPKETSAAPSIAGRGATPSDILNIPAYSTDHTGDDPPYVPATPMPGTNFSLEVDGANSDKSDKSQVFERTVTPHNEKERKELRTMRSLDAMAEACTVAHASDEMNGNPELTDARRWSDPGFSMAPASPELEFYTPQRGSWSGISGTTITQCPSDMEVITRQSAPEPMTESDSRQELWPEDLIGDDPFTTSSGPPSPLRRVLLPFRPKIAIEGEMTTAAFAAGGHSSGNQVADSSENLQPMDLSVSFSSEYTTDAQIQPQRSHAAAQCLKHNIHLPGDTSSFGETEPVEYFGSDDDTQPRMRGLLASGVAFHEYHCTDSPVSNGLSPNGGPLVPELYQCIQDSNTPSRGSARSRATYTAGLGDAEYKFTFENWLRTTSTAHGPDDEALQIPQRRSMDVSIDSVSTNDDRQTPQISPMSRREDHTPSMGNKLEFNLKRSQRNMRYNALQQDTEVEHADPELSMDRPQIRFILGNSEGIDADAFALADFDNAYASSHAGTPQKDSKAVENTETEPVMPQKGLESDLARLSFSRPQEMSTMKKVASDANVLKSNGFLSINPVNSLCESVPTAVSITSALIERSPTPTRASPGTQGDISESSADSPPTRTNTHAKDRAVSSDTLDDSLTLFSSPSSGYQADKSSVSPSAIPRATPASHRRSPSKRASTRKIVGESSDNVA